MAISKELLEILACPQCKGARLRPESRAVRLGGMAIHEFSALSARRAIEWVGALELSESERAIARLILREIDERLRFLENVGVGYLSMERAASTIAGAASRILACHTGESTTKTSLGPETFANRACAASEGDKWGRKRWSIASSHRARRTG